MNNANRTCEDCKHCILQDEGYSNYTVEGTTFSCAAQAHPNETFDRWYGEDGRLRWAVWCKHFEEGWPLRFDVDDDWVHELRMPEDDEQADYIRRAIIHKFGTPEKFEDHLVKYTHGTITDHLRAIVKAAW